MKIKKVELENFKFHQKLKFAIDKKNCLIYGENGTGKSSIYEALNAIFTLYFRDSNFSLNKFKNYSSTEALSAKVTFDNADELIIPKEDMPLMGGKKTIYFANQDLLESIILNNNFYDTIKNSFKNIFPILHNFRKNFEFINSRIDSSNYQEENTKRQDNIKNMERFLWRIELRANDILNNHFEEKFTIKFEYDWGLSNTTDDFKYPNPKIILNIDDKKFLKLNFNEAKLKLASIAIFFALIKVEEDLTNPLKLLVLDDFLTSLDMANRHYIIEYIFDKFEKYQKIILTHNLQFYNLILSLLKSRDELNNWDNKNIFLQTIGTQKKAIIYDKETDYIKLAESYLKVDKLDEAGIYLRKEFERLIEELRQINEVGVKEKLSKIVNQLIKLDDSTDINILKMQNILKRTKFYQDTILHSTAHDDISNERYTKELNGAIVILKQLDKLVKSIGTNS
ncbi:MAG: AAA family ATPase [Sulfurovum sp.]|nr:AAA family ATPase [Sulfurovum sp.]